jgi:cysteine desulfurase / selenocysteine lyase
MTFKSVVIRLFIMTIDQFKKQFYSGSEFIHLNNSGQALIPDVYRKKAIFWLEKLYSEGALCAVEGWGQTDEVRKKLAHFLGAESSEVSFFTTTSSAISQAALGIPLKSGDEILTWQQEYPSNFYPWRVGAEKSGAKLIQIESSNFETPIEKILESVSSKTKAIAVSWVQYQTGSVTNLSALAEKLKSSGIWLVADVIQGVGVRPFNFHESGFDIVCGGSHKFLCSGYGAGYMITKKSRLEEIDPIGIGAMTFGTPETVKSFSIKPKSNGSRFEPGTKSMVEIIGMGATLDLFSETGIENIFQEASRLANRLRKGLQELKFKVVSTEGPILNFFSEDSAQLSKAMELLTAAKVSFAVRGPGIRISTHAYNSDEQIDRVLEVLA